MLDLRMQGSKEALSKEGLQLQTGETFDIIISENPSTGYAWQVDTSAEKGMWTIKEEHT